MGGKIYRELICIADEGRHITIAYQIGSLLQFSQLSPKERITNCRYLNIQPMCLVNVVVNKVWCVDGLLVFVGFVLFNA